VDKDGLRALLERVRGGDLSIDDAIGRLHFLEAADLGFARVDRGRAARCGFPEVIYCPGKRPEDAVAIAHEILAHGGKLLATRTTPEHAAALLESFPDAVHHERARAVTVRRTPARPPRGRVLVLTAGSADVPVAEESAVTAEIMDSFVERIYDVGVAGIHRLLACRESLQRANVIVVAAGMEGALPSVVAGLVDRPVIAVPTSVGYGVSLGGFAALATMLSSCAAGIAVVNIDNGFGAGYLAALIDRPPGRDDERGSGENGRG
jgi:pyridinium-3,5-biscarboxylic acid mononucleotide synthase